MKAMRITSGRFLLRSIKYIILMNAFLFLLCGVFDGDFDPTWIGNVAVPMICAYASLWGEKKRMVKKAKGW